MRIIKENPTLKIFGWLSEDLKGSDGYSLTMDVIMTHRRVLIAKDNLGVRLLMSKNVILKIFFILKHGVRKKLI